jgi:hypothetical protein
MKQLLWLILIAGCATGPSVLWLREDVHPVAVKGDRRLDHVRLWSGKSTFEWRDVLVTHDSISGTPVQCESCRVALPTAAVDSLSVGYARDVSGGGSGDEPDTPVWAPLFILALLFCP